MAGKNNGKSPFGERVPPNSLEMEASVLGAMLIERPAVDVACDRLQPADFYSDKHRAIFEAIRTLYHSDQRIDLLTVQEQLRRDNTLDKLDGPSDLLLLTDAVPTAVHVDHYARQVEERALQRRMIDAANRIYHLAYTEYEDISEVLTTAEQAVTSILAERTDGAWRMEGEVRASELPPALELTELWFGLYPGRFTLLIGETGAGKSAVLYNLVLALARGEGLWGLLPGVTRPLRVYHIDPENAGDYRSERRDGGQCKRRMEAIMGPEGVLPPTILFADGEGMNLSSATHRARLERRIQRGDNGNPFDLIILDPIVYLFAVENENDNAEMGRVSKWMMQLSRRTGCAVLGVHHTGKPGANPISGALAGRGASALAGSADVVMTLRARGAGEETKDDEYRGETVEGSDVERLRIEKDRPGLFGRSSLYLLQAGQYRFRRVTIQEWRQAGELAERGSQMERACTVVREILCDWQWHTRKDILSEFRDRGIGRNSVDGALEAMTKSGEIEASRMAGATLAYRFPDNSTDGNVQNSVRFPDFPISRSPARAREDAKEEDTSHLTQFFQGTTPAPQDGEDPPGYDPFADADKGGEA